MPKWLFISPENLVEMVFAVVQFRYTGSLGLPLDSISSTNPRISILIIVEEDTLLEIAILRTTETNFRLVKNVSFRRLKKIVVFLAAILYTKKARNIPVGDHEGVLHRGGNFSDVDWWLDGCQLGPQSFSWHTIVDFIVVVFLVNVTDYVCPVM